MQILTPRGFERRTSNPLAPYGSTAPPTNSQIGYSTSGVTERSALQIAAVYGSVSFISDAVATLPIRQYRLVGGEAKQMDVAPVIRQPWAEFTQRDFLTQGTVSMLLRGTLWGKKLGLDSNGCPVQVQLVHPDHARIRRLQTNGETGDAGQLEVRYWNQTVPWEQVTRAMALQVPEGLQGLNPIEYMRNSFGVAFAQDTYNNQFFANSARPDGVIEVPEDLDEDETKAMATSWAESHSTSGGKAFKPAVLTGGAVWKPITMSLADAQFLEQVGYSASVISGMIYRVPPHALGMTEKSTSWGNGIEQQELGFVRNTLLIWLNRWEDLMTSWLPPRQFVTFDLSQRLRGDTLQRFSAYQIARVAGFMSNLDIMREEGRELPTDPNLIAQLSDYAAPLNSAPVKPTSTGGAGGDKSD